jgi:two-component system, NtrC family, sensor kinase
MVTNEVLESFVNRERSARKEAESLLEERSRQLYQSNATLTQMAAALEDEVRRTQAIVETAAEGIITFDSNGNIESINTAAQTIFGYDAHKAIAKNICDLVPSALFCDSSVGCALNLLEYTKTDHGGEITGIKSDGTTIPLEIVVSEFTHACRTSFTAMLRDLTRRKQLETQLAHAQKMESVGQLAAGIAHEINTPIQYVGDNTRFLKTSFEGIERILHETDQLLEQCSAYSELDRAVQSLRALFDEVDISFLREEIPSAIDQTLEGAESVARIVRAMKDFSHPGSEERIRVDLNRALENTLTVCKNEWKYVADLKTNFAEDLPQIDCLPGELNQVFLNLIVNAAHAIESQMGAKRSNERGTLTVATKSIERWAVVEVTDTGCGIPEAIQSRIFDPFFTTKAVGKGTGQGLAICYNVVVEKHQGKLFFTTEPGAGTTFHVWLPLSPDARPLNGSPLSPLTAEQSQKVMV